MLLRFFLGFLLAFILTFFVRYFVQRLKIFDYPGERKLQTKPIPLLGGLAIFFAFNLVVLFFLPQLLGGYLLPKYLWGIFLAGLVLMIGGFLDDKYNLKPKQQIIFPLIATLIIIASGISVSYLFSGRVPLEQFNITLFYWHDLPYKITLWADVFVFFWLLGMMYTTKFLDGLDGLASGVGVIGSLIIYFLSLKVVQPETAILAIIFAGTCLGFLIWNWHPAKIFLGEGGSLYIGFILGVLSIISGAKVATALLVMGIPILDVVWVIGRRIFKEKHSPFLADQGHLHFRLLEARFSHRQAVLFLWLLVTIFGFSSIFIQGREKLLALFILMAVMLILVGGVLYLTKKKR